MLLHWQEHCVECAPPQCYESCLLYVPRADRKCARLVYGFTPNPAFFGLLNCGADVRFRRWGKIEAKVRPRAIRLRTHRWLATSDRLMTAGINVLSTLLRPLSPHRRLNGALTLLRGHLLDWIAGRVLAADYDDFVLECFSPEAAPVRLLLELWNGGSLAFRQSLLVLPGHNLVTLSAKTLTNLINWSNARLSIYPEDDQEARLVFTWLDFVKYRAGEGAPVQPQLPAAKVKCLAWDLDNTLWRGVFIEDGASNLVLRPEAVELIRRLDERGILQTIVSKNEFEPVWAVITQQGLEDYFLWPAINWGAKSTNLAQIAKQLNLGVDSFALIDDSPFERAEVEASLPMVRTYSEKQIPELLKLAEFDVSVTEMSRMRRASYLTEMQRTQVQQSYPGNYKEFLRSCQMTLRVFVPRERSAAQRCHELVQRSNQLNLSSRRYSAEEFDALLATPGVLCLALHCADRFGDYGIVGFVTVDERCAEPCVTNFVLSCRVAQKQIEHAFFHWLAQRERQRSCQKLLADLVVTRRNGPLVAVFDELAFQHVRGVEGKVLLELPLDGAPAAQDVVGLRVELAE